MDTIRFSKESATALLHPLDANAYLLSNVHSSDKGHGHAAALLMEIINWADEHEATIFLTVQRYGNPREGLSNQELVEFYSKYGFERDQRLTKPVRMIRYFKEG